MNDGPSTNDSHDSITIPLGVAESFKHHNAATFAAAKPVGGCRERFATTVGRKQTGFGHQQRIDRNQNRVHTTGQREIAVSVLKVSNRLHQCDQRTTAGRIDGNAWPLESKRVTDPTDARTVRKPGALERFDNVLVIKRRNERVVLPHDAHEHTDVGIGKRRQRDPGVFHRVVTILQQHPMLRVDPTGFLFGDIEKCRVEVGDVFEEAALASVHLSRLAIFTVKAIDIPAI